MSANTGVEGAGSAERRGVALRIWLVGMLAS
jgi:hypothetical protein